MKEFWNNRRGIDRNKGCVNWGGKFFLLYSLLCSCLFLWPAGVLGQELPGTKKKEISEKEKKFNEGLLKYLQKKYQKDPRNLKTTYSLAILHRKMGHLKEAKVYFKEAITLSPTVPRHINLAEVTLALKEYGETLEALSAIGEKIEKIGYALYLKGVALYYTEKYQEALEAFKRVVNREPSLSQPADYYSALCCSKLGQFKEAQRYLLLVTTRNPHSTWGKMAMKDLKSLVEQSRQIKKEKGIEGEELAGKASQKKKPYSIFFSLEGNWDDNPTLTPDESNIANVVVARKTSDFLGVMNFKAAWTQEIVKDFQTSLGYSFYGDLYDRLDGFEVQSHNVFLLPDYRIKNQRLNLLLGYNYVFLNELPYLYGLTVAPSYSMLMKQKHLGKITATYQYKNYFSVSSPPEDRGGNLFGTALDYYFLWNKGQNHLSFSASYHYHKTDGKNWEHGTARVAIGLFWTPVKKLTLSCMTDIIFQHFVGSHTLLLKKREDLRYSLFIQLNYNLYKGLDLFVKYNFAVSDSNIPLYDYNRNLFGWGISYLF